MESAVSFSITGLVLNNLAFTVLGVVGAWLLLRSKLVRLQAELSGREIDLRESQKAIYEKERAFLEERNRIELMNADKMKDVKSLAFEEGRQLGNIEARKQHLEEMLALKTEASEKHASEIGIAVSEVTKRITAEHELKAKAFSVQISPFVNVTENKKLLGSTSLVESGYQYQLLVNGIPAFQPHLVVENREERKVVDDQKIKELLTIATEIASKAIDTQLGAGGSVLAKLAPAIVKRLPKI